MQTLRSTDTPLLHSLRGDPIFLKEKRGRREEGRQETEPHLGRLKAELPPAQPCPPPSTIAP